MIISFVGPSASGKSSYIQKVQDKLGTIDKFTVIEEDKFFFKKVVNFLFRFKGISSIDINAKLQRKYNSNSSLVNTLVAYLYAILVYFEYLFRYIYFKFFSDREIIIFDRYIFDYYITIKHNLKLNSKLIEKLYLSFPSADLTFFCDITIEESMKRNKNDIKSQITSTKNFHVETLKEYRRISNNKNFVKLNAKNTLSTNSKIVEESIAFYRFFKIKRQKIIIMGTDGSGKSTICQNLQKKLDDIGINSKVVHFYNEPLVLKFLGSIAPNSLFNNKTLKQKRIKAMKDRKNGKTFLWGLAYTIDGLTQYLLYTLLYFNKVIIFDRYFYDYSVSFSYFKVPMMSLLSKMFIYNGLVIYVTCEPKVAYNRKKENSLEYYKFASIEYKKLYKAYGDIKVDSSKLNSENLFKKLWIKLEEYISK